MRLIGMMAVRNEAWCLGLSLRVALLWCDAVVVLLHACTDDSPAIVEAISAENPGRVVVRTHRHEVWTEMAHRQHMLEIARGMGATHLAIIDADEILSGDLCMQTLSFIRGPVENTPKDSILQLPGYNLRHGINQYHSNGIWGERWFSTAFADAPDLGWSGDKFHSREPGPRRLQSYRPIQQGQGGILHLWGCSERRLRAKHCAYKIAEHLRKMNTVEHIELTYNDWRSPADNLKHWPSQKEWGEPWTFASVPESWWEPYREWIDKYLDVDAELWQEKECQRLVALHGREMFAGLDLFGVA